MTKKEWIATVVMSAVALGLLVYIWPYPERVDTSQQARRALEDSLRRQRPPSAKKAQAAGTLLKEMKEAAREMAEQFPALRDAALKAASEGELEEAQAYAGELPAPGEKVVVQMLLVADGEPTFEREKGRSRVAVEGLDSPDFDNAGKTGPDYELLASVLAALAVRRQADSGEGLVVELVPAPFVPLESLKKALEAAARAGVMEIELKQPPIPY